MIIVDAFDFELSYIGADAQYYHGDIRRWYYHISGIDIIVAYMGVGPPSL